MTLQDVVNNELKIIGTTYPGRSYHAIHHIINSIDYVILSKDSYYREFFSFGWPNLLKYYYDDIVISEYEPFVLMNEKLISWAYSNILHSGKIEFCKQLIAYEKAGLIKITSPQKNVFTFNYLHENSGIESLDVKSHAFYIEKIIEQFIAKKQAKKKFNEQKIKAEFRKLIKNPYGKLISYTTTPEIDEYYEAQGHYYILRLQGYDEFDKSDVFGGIEYWKYIDIIELIVGVALKHLDACLELKKLNPEVDLHNLITYTKQTDKTVHDFADYSGFSYDEVSQIFSCITLSKDNFQYYLEYPASPPPVYFQVSDNILIRSLAGCLDNPFSLLNREIKRKYKRDYDKALNNREGRFRKELFGFFPQEHIVKIPREINISFKGMRTDIDAVAFDTKTGTLGLFQLKWQDPFAKSMTERYSRITNLFPKAKEWIDKMRFWVFNNSYKTIINSLQIDKYYNGKMPINEICVFIISRNTINFTGVEKDETVAWSSWYQLIEAEASIRTNLNDPIREMFIKIKNFDPKIRLEREKLEEVDDIEVYIGNTKIYYKKENNH